MTPPKNPWSDEEKALIRRLMADGLTPSKMKQSLPGRTIGAINSCIFWHRYKEARDAGLPEPVRYPTVDRDPCPRCGVRADIGCSHSRRMAA